MRIAELEYREDGEESWQQKAHRPAERRPRPERPTCPVGSHDSRGRPHPVIVMGGLLTFLWGREIL